jgi:hypothetical protein
MRWFRKPSSQPEEEPSAAEAGALPEVDTPAEEPVAAMARRQPLACAGCKQVKPPYVYTENDKDYCLDCARTNLGVLRLYPAGRRTDDIKLEDLLLNDSEVIERLQGAHDAGGASTPEQHPPAEEQRAS